jgi:hypothetical protein
LASLKSLTRTNFETQNSFFENSTKLLTNQIDQTVTGFKNPFQETLETLEKSNQKTAESLNENFGTKIDLALEIVASKVDASSQETREYFESKVDSTMEKTVESLQNSIIKATDERLNQSVELIEAKLAKTEIALDLEKSRVLLLEGKIVNLVAEVKSLAKFVGKQFDEFKEILRGRNEPLIFVYFQEFFCCFLLNFCE